MGNIRIISAEDLAQFKDELIAQLKELLSGGSQQKWVRSKDVRKLLGISDSTLQTMRVNSTIPSYKLGSSWYYKYDEIIAVLEASKMGGN